MSKRFGLQNYLPEAHKLMKELDAVAKSGVDPQYLELIKVRASQLNGCSFCMNMHSYDAIKVGIPQEKLFVLSAWEEAKDWFTAEEQIVLRITEEVTMIGEHGISDETYDEAVNLLGEQKLAYILLAAININSWNRVGVGLKMHPMKHRI